MTTKIGRMVLLMTMWVVICVGMMPAWTGTVQAEGATYSMR